jgi:hypothetical protein
VTLKTWLRDGWFLFSVCFSAAIFVTLVLPAPFGLQNFTQWGAMYDDRWCTVHQFESNPHLEGARPRTRLQFLRAQPDELPGVGTHALRTHDCGRLDHPVGGARAAAAALSEWEECL